MHTGEPLYHDDIEAGTRFVSETYPLTQADIVEFAPRSETRNQDSTVVQAMVAKLLVQRRQG